MSAAQPGPHEPVGVDLASAAAARLDAETRQTKRRTGRRLALTAIAVAIVLTTAFCGTGVVVNAQQLRVHQRYRAWSSIAAEYDCCFTPPTGRAVEACAEAVAALDAVHDELGRSSLAAQFSEWILATTGISPELFSVNVPAAAEIAALHASCHR